MNNRPIGEREKIIFRRQWVMEQRRKMQSLDEIHRAWNAAHTDETCSRSTIANDIKESLKKSVELTNLATVEWRQLHIERIERVLGSKKFQKLLDEADLFAIDRFDKLTDKLIKLTGAYMPTKVAQTDASGEVTVTQLTDDERLARINELLKKAEERKIAAEAEAELREE